MHVLNHLGIIIKNILKNSFKSIATNTIVPHRHNFTMITVVILCPILKMLLLLVPAVLQSLDTKNIRATVLPLFVIYK